MFNDPKTLFALFVGGVVYVICACIFFTMKNHIGRVVGWMFLLLGVAILTPPLFWLIIGG